MMQPADARQFDYLALAGRSALYRPATGCILSKAQMRSVVMIIFEIRRQNVSQVTLVQHNDMVCTFSSDRSNFPFNKRILPRALRGRDYFFEAHVFHSIAKEDAIDRIPVSHQIFWRSVPGEGLYDLLCCPLGRRILGYIEMHDFAPAVAKDHQNEQNIESNCRNGEKIDRTLVCMIVQESPPRLRWL